MHPTGIEWAKYVWNPVHGCAMPESCAVREHCYAKRMATRLRGRYGYPKDNPMRPTFEHPKLNNLKYFKKPRRIFVGSMCDLWGDWIKDEWIKAVLDAASKSPQHTFMFLTKNPQRYSEFYNEHDSLLPEHSWVGTTINKNNDLGRLDIISAVDKAEVRFVSFEPLMEPMIDIRHHEKELERVDWFIIGAQTRPRMKPQPEWVWGLLDIAREHGIKVFLKHNLGCAIRIQELPTPPGSPRICDRCGADVSMNEVIR